MSNLTTTDGREFTLVVDFEALIQAESAYGKPLPKLQEDAKAGFIGAVRALAYGALTSKHPRITQAEVADLFQADGDALGLALAEAVKAFKVSMAPASSPAKPKRKPAKKTA